MSACSWVAKSCVSRARVAHRAGVELGEFPEAAGAFDAVADEGPVEAAEGRHRGCVGDDVAVTGLGDALDVVVVDARDLGRELAGAAPRENRRRARSP